MKSIPALFASTCLSAILDRVSAGCREGRTPPPEVCLNTFVWCRRSNDCSFPEDIWPLPPRPWRADGMLRDDETYVVAWEGILSDDEIELQVTFDPTPESNIQYYSKEFSYKFTPGSRTDYTFEPYQLLTEIAGSDMFNGTLGELQAMAATMRIQITVLVTRNEDILVTDDAQSGYFSIMSPSAAMAANWQKDHAFAEERRKWKLGVGIGVGLGLPILMGATVLLTRWTMRRGYR